MFHEIPIKWPIYCSHKILFMVILWEQYIGHLMGIYIKQIIEYGILGENIIYFYNEGSSVNLKLGFNGKQPKVWGWILGANHFHFVRIFHGKNKNQIMVLGVTENVGYTLHHFHLFQCEIHWLALFDHQIWVYLIFRPVWQCEQLRYGYCATIG